MIEQLSLQSLFLFMGIREKHLRAWIRNQALHVNKIAF